MSSAPRVSVLLPCYNAASTLDEAIDSLVKQTFREIEIVAVDDGSSDETSAILQRWRGYDSRICTLQMPHAGIVPALNRAASMARGDLLARMDADDICLPQRLEKQIALIAACPQLVGCGTKIRYFPRPAVRAGARRYETWINSLVSPAEIERDLFVECPIPHPTLLLHRLAWEHIGGYRDVPWPEDYDLFLRLWAAGYQLGKTSDVLLEWRESPARLSRVDGRYRRDSFLQCKVAFLPRIIRHRPVVIWGTGPVGRNLGRALQRNGEQVRAFVTIDPTKVGRSILGQPIVAPSNHLTAGYFHIAAVGSLAARVTIRTALETEGLEEMTDYCAVA